MSVHWSLQDPSADEFLAHPDFRQIAAFFLGWVFIISLKHISTLFQRAFWPSHSDSSSLSSENESQTVGLGLTLSLCFAFASLAYFISLLNFHPNGTACSFVVTWGGVSAQCARLVGLVILILELRHLGLPRWESALFWTWLFIGSTLVFLTNAVTIGVTRPVQALNVSLCYKKHFLPTSLGSSLIYLSMEVYVFVRAMSLVAPPFLRVRHRLGGVRDSRVVRATSLILLELLSLVSTPRVAGILEDFVPFSIGSVLVLSAFNYRVIEPEASDYNPSSCPSIRSRRSGRPSLVITIDSRVPSYSFSRRSISDQVLENGDRYSTKTADSDFEYVKSVAVARVACSRNQRSAKVVRVPPLPLSAPLAISDVGNDGMCQIKVTPRRILPSQVSYAERFEREVDHNVGGLSTRPRVVGVAISSDLPQSTSRPTSGFCNSPNSAFYGSDIIRMDSDRSFKDKTRRRTSVVLSTQRSEIHSPRESLMSASTTPKRYSLASLSAPLAPLNDDLSMDTYGSTKSNSIRHSKKMPRWPTFDEQHFRSIGHVITDNSTMSQRPFSGILTSPRSGQRVRGPRPPPTTERSPLLQGL